MNTQVKGRKKVSATDARNLRTLLLLSVFAPEDIGARLKQARLEAGLTQEDMADLVGVSTRSWQGYEAGDVVPYRQMERIGEITQRTVAWLLHGDIEADESVDERLGKIEGQLDAIRGLLEEREDGNAKPQRAPSR
jgi:transcriptional regulator with XRE-family HTH domain